MIVYRAAPLESELRYNDHVTPGFRYAKDHAITSSIYNGEDYGVFVIILKEEDLKPATNPDGSEKPGQFHYIGDGSAEYYLRGIARYDEDIADSTYTRVALKYSSNARTKVRGLYGWLSNNGFDKEAGMLKESMPRPHGSLFNIPSGERPDEEFGPDEVTNENISNMRVECEEKVCWYGDDRRMIRIDVDYMYPIHGNIFYPDMIKRIEEEISNASYLYPARFHCGYCEVKKIDISTIKEYLAYSESDLGHSKLTTGDEELDKYLLDKEEYLSDWQSNYDEETAEEMLQNAISNSEGDIGKYIYQMRDGNHRAFGAKNAGEKYIWAEMSTSQYDSMKEDSYGIYSDMSDLKKTLFKK